MAISFRSSTTDADSSGNISFTQPSGQAEDDLLVALVCYEGGADENVTPPTETPAWSSEIQAANSSNIGLSVFWKIAGSSESWPKAFDVSNSKKSAAGIHAYEGVDTSDTLEASSTNDGSSGDATMAAVTVNETNTILIFGAGNKKGSTWSGWTGSMTERHEISNSGDGIAGNAGASEPIAGTGSTGTRDVTPSDDAEWAAIGIAFNEGGEPPITIPVDTLALASNARSVTVAPGATSVLQDTLNLTGIARDFTVIRDEFVALNTLALTGSPEALSIYATVTITMNVLALASLALSSAIFTGKRVIVSTVVLAGLAVTPEDIHSHVPAAHYRIVEIVHQVPLFPQHQINI